MALILKITFIIFALSNNTSNDLSLLHSISKDTLGQRADASSVSSYSPQGAVLLDSDWPRSFIKSCPTTQQTSKPLHHVGTTWANRFHLNQIFQTTKSNQNSKSFLNGAHINQSSVSATCLTMPLTFQTLRQSIGGTLYLKRLASFDSSPHWEKPLTAKSNRPMKKIIVKPGDRYGRLTVLREVDPHMDVSGKKSRQFKFLCDCGNTAIIKLTQVRNNGTVSCGCRMREAQKEYVQSKKLKMIGKKFGRLTVVKEVEKYEYESGRTTRQFLCRCKCGNEVIKVIEGLTSGNFKSCGLGCVNSKHGMSRTPIHNVYYRMIDRCENPNNKRFIHYGGRGIKVCDRWKESFDNFLKDMGSKWFKGASIERIDVNGDYSPENCKWIPVSEQSKNRRCVRRFKYKGKMLTIRQLANYSKVSYRTLKNRIYKGWEIADAVERDYSPQKYWNGSQ